MRNVINDDEYVVAGQITFVAAHLLFVAALEMLQAGNLLLWPLIGPVRR